MDKNLSPLEKSLGQKFKNIDLLRQALVHRSYLNENNGFKLDHNERLEFLGDAVLELVTTEYLYTKFPKKPEGEMTNIRAALVNTHMLSKVSRSLGINDFLYLSKGEEQGQSKARNIILADAIEAIIGAIYLDRGYKDSQEFIESHILEKVQHVLKEKIHIDPKSELQEKTQELYNITPSYQVLKEEGPDHKKHFTIGVFVEDHQLAEGEGYSKQQAQIAAAKKALDENTYENLDM